MNNLPYSPNLKKKARQLRKAGNLSEALLWLKLKKKQVCGCDFTRQQVVGNYIVDFYCPKLKLAIEVDGISHNFKGEHDEKREAFLRTAGIEVLHICDREVKHNMGAVIEKIKEVVRERTVRIPRQV